MTGYQYIKNMTIEQISKAFGVGKLSATNIKGKGKEELITSAYTCPQLLDFKTKWPCNYQETKCRECMKDFLENEIPDTLPIIQEPCIHCMELDFCQGQFPCRKLEEYNK